MKFLAMTIALPALVAFAVPANAQQYSPGSNYGSLSGKADMASRIAALKVRLDAGVANGSITRTEAVPLTRQIRLLAGLERRFRADGISGQERAALQKHIQAVRKQLRSADAGANRRYSEWDDRDDDNWAGSQRARVDADADGFDDRDYNRNGRLDDTSNAGFSASSRYGGWVDSNRDGWDDRDPGRSGRLDDDMRRAPPPAAPGAAPVETLLGGVGLQVGHHAPANLYAVPYGLQARFRDVGRLYHRSDGRRIYRIDATSNIIVGVFAL